VLLDISTAESIIIMTVIIKADNPANVAAMLY